MSTVFQLYLETEKQLKHFENYVCNLNLIKVNLLLLKGEEDPDQLEIKYDITCQTINSVERIINLRKSHLEFLRELSYWEFEAIKYRTKKYFNKILTFIILRGKKESISL